jgi:hypothetical protein
MKSQAVKKESKEVVNPLSDKIIKVLATSIYENLMSEGCQDKDIIGVSSQLLGLVTIALESKQKK